MNIQHLTKTIHHTVYPAISPSNPLNSAKGKTVVISGGASGIGYSIAQSFAAAGAATVVIIARRQEALDEASTKLRAEIASAGRPTDIWTYLVDITKEAAVNDAFEDIRKRLNANAAADSAPKDADVLITSAAHISSDRTAVDYANSDYRAAFETNLFGNLNLVRAFLKPETPAIPFTSFGGVAKQAIPSSFPHNQKVLLDVSTLVAFTLFPGQATYGSSKMAFTRAMSQLQMEVDGLPGTPIRIHSFHPGIVFTPAISTIMGKKDPAFVWDDESLPGGFAVWLASPAAAFLKGRFVLSCWDVDEMMAVKDKFEQDPTFGTITHKF
ncbi:short-chain dehydrogenase reductase sdr protein [Stemphylium lycopersici]|uniref:Short-chain dehydrogenase reductase sdr protein n=1 Tax=Stemphylium lycopersici TaxID=183478 RepID=A0A364MZW6_STELY|nr:short-chain dehydrogenase reductase sdr protein [Stemphylium lycopersici]RAR08185.1 short-chain dehydrogenase reductase sdr protein [Stemphylium lycopersici]